jgi:hypothetical protein
MNRLFDHRSPGFINRGSVSFARGLTQERIREFNVSFSAFYAIETIAVTAASIAGSAR